MTLDKAREYMAVQADMGGGYNRNGAKMILFDVQKNHGQAGVDTLIREYNLEEIFGFKVGTEFILK